MNMKMLRMMNLWWIKWVSVGRGGCRIDLGVGGYGGCIDGY